jgi:alpha-glucosidase
MELNARRPRRSCRSPRCATMCCACASAPPASCRKTHRGPCCPHRAPHRSPSRRIQLAPPSASRPPGSSSPCAKIRSELTVTDLAGHVIAEDLPGRPIEYNGAFPRLRQSPPDEHYFGLGDKPGPLDRRNEAFVDWNTDAFGWQESTDPIYKSIPFFITYNRKGIAAATFLDNTWRASFEFNKEVPRRLLIRLRRRPARLLHSLRPRAQSRRRSLGLAGRHHAAAAALVARLSAVALQLLSRIRSPPHRRRLRSERIPADVIWLDIDYQLKNRPFTVDPEKFPTSTR